MEAGFYCTRARAVEDGAAPGQAVLSSLPARLRDPAARRQVKEEVLGLREPEDTRGWERRAMFMNWEDILIADAQTPGMAGKNAAEIAEEQHKEPIDAIIDLLAEDGGQVGAVYKNLYQEAGITAIMQHPQHMVGSDGIFSPGVPHPRLYGICRAAQRAHHSPL